MLTKPVLPLLYIEDEDSFKNALIRLHFINASVETGLDCKYGDYSFSCRLIKALGCKCFEDLKSHFNRIELNKQKRDKIDEMKKERNKWEV